MEKGTSHAATENRGETVMSHPCTMRMLYAGRRVLLLFTVFALFPPCLMAESAAAKNKEGNSLFEQGNYEDAEKAYLEAQGNVPGKPEILYNLGNALIKQNKFDQGIQSLHQSIGKGNKEIREHSWFNAGNASYLAGRFKDSVEAYVQALKLDPADKDAKHNLELALMKLKEQNSKNDKSNPSGDNKENPQQADDDNQSGAGNGNDQNASAKQQTPPPAQPEGSISREQALQILDAMKSRELEDRRQRMVRPEQQQGNKKDW